MARKNQKQDLQFFEGRVHHWELKWVPVVKGIKNDEVRLELMKWIPTDELTPDPTGPRNPHLKPVKDARNKPLVAHVDLTQPHLEGEHPQLADAPGMYPPPDHPHGAAMGQPPGYMDPHYMGAPPGQPGYPMDPMQGGMPPPGYPMQQGMPMQPGLGPPMHPDMHGGIPPPGYVPGGGPPGGYMPMDAMHGHMPGGPPHGAYMGPGPGYQPGPHTGPPM